MSFVSLPFLLFLVVFFALYWGLAERRRQNALLTVASYIFYGWWDYRFCALILLSSLVDYGVGRALMHSDVPRVRRAWLAVSVIFNLGLLGFFKYFNFFAQEFQAMTAELGWTVDTVTLYVVLPVGISFYTFQTLGYTVDVYRRHTDGTRSLLDYLTYVSFFPQLVAGPIERAQRLLNQFEASRRFDHSQAVAGCRQMLWGFFKKMVIADNLAPIVDRAYAAPDEFGGPVLALATVCFAFQLYCDFSAYSDIAIGTAKLFGISLMRNFDHPYFSRSVVEFWRRWHISLSTWLRDYVYIPLGGNRHHRFRNVILTMALGGLWHGANWTFVVWGLYHGVLICLTRALSARRPFAAWVRCQAAWAQALKVAGTFALVVVGYVFFRAESFADATGILRTVGAGLLSAEGWAELALWLGEKDVAVVLGVVLGFAVVEWSRRGREHPLERPPRSLPLRWGLYTAMIWVSLTYGTHSNSPFIYFQF